MNGPINTSYTYRNQGRRSFHINKKLRKNVALVQGHELKYHSEQNLNFLGLNGQSTYSVMAIGGPVTNDLFMDFAKRHWSGYLSTDVNTVSGSAEQFKLKLKVMSSPTTFLGVNSSNVKLHVVVYQLTPKHDIHQANLLPAAAMATYLRQGDLGDSLTNTPLITDIYLTPYMIPAITQNYNIKKTRGFIVHGGGKFNIVMNHSYDINYGLDSQAFGWDTGIVAKKGQYRANIIKFTGELGVVAQDASKFIRNLAFEVIGKLYVNAKLHVSEETRAIYIDEGLNTSRNVAGGGLEIFQGEEDQALRPKDPLLPTTTA